VVEPTVVYHVNLGIRPSEVDHCIGPYNFLATSWGRQVQIDSSNNPRKQESARVRAPTTTATAGGVRIQGTHETAAT
jgi:hypothetical protein